MSAESYLKSVYIDAKPIERGLQNKMVANYRDKIGPSGQRYNTRASTQHLHCPRPTCATQEHQPNNNPNFLLHNTFKHFILCTCTFIEVQCEFTQIFIILR
jgi:hypothetical protein